MVGSNLEIFILTLGIVIGCFQCFFGYRTFKAMLFATGFLLGFAAGVVSYGLFARNESYAFISGIFGGILGAALMGVLYLVGLFVLGACLGGILVVVLYTLFQSPPHPEILGVSALILGALTLKFQKFMIILVTAVEGSWLMIMGMALLLQSGFTSPDPYYFFYPTNIRMEIFFPIWLLLAIVGFMYQCKKQYPIDKSPRF
jgi:hypothetical protein